MNCTGGKYDLYKKVIYKFPRRPTVINGKNDIWGVDLADYSKDGHPGYILTVIDYYTRKVWTRRLTRKSEVQISDALESIFLETGEKPKKIHCDKESALIHNKMLKKNGIDIYHTYFMGSPITERVIRTIKEMIEKERQKITAKSWKPVVESVTNVYNNNIHSSIGAKPNDAYIDPELVREKNHLNSYEKRKEPKTRLNVGDHVLTYYEKEKFVKGYKQRWNEDPNIVVRVINSNPMMYELDDGNRYYIQELQKITKDDYDELINN